MKNLKPFVLSEALEGKPVITRDGREVTQLHEFKNIDSPYCLAGVLEGRVYAFKLDGINIHNGEKTDLFMAPIKTKYYINVYKDYEGNIVNIMSKFPGHETTTKAQLITQFEFEIDE